MATEEFRVRFTQDGAKEIIRTFNDTVRASESAENAAGKIKKALNEVRREADPAQRSYDKFAKAVNTLDKAQRAGLITSMEAGRLQGRLGIQYQSALRPISTLISKIGEETRAWGQTRAEREALLRTIQHQEALQRRGIAITEQERAAILSANRALADKREALRLTEQAEKDAQRAALASLREQRQAAKAAEADQERQIAQTLKRQQQQRAALVSEVGTLNLNAGDAGDQAQQRLIAAERTLAEARSRGIITAQQEADIQGRLNKQYHEALDPLAKAERLQNERVAYLSGLFREGRQLAQVNRDLARLEQQGVMLDAQRVASLRKKAKEADKLQHAFEGLNRVTSLMSTAFAGLGVGFLAGEFTRSLDTVTTLNNRLQLVGTGQANVNRLFAENVQIAKDTRTSLESTIELYSRLARSTQQLGLGQERVLKLTKGVNQAILISGATAQEASASMVQFGQALASNRLGGDELRSVLEQAPRLASALVDGLNDLNKIKPEFARQLKDEIKKTGQIGIGSLRKLGKEGVLTSKIVVAALESQTDKLNEEFKRTTPTIAQSFEVLKTSWLSFLNDFNKGTGAAGAIAKAIMFVSDNLQTIVGIASVVGAGLIGAFVTKQITSFLSFLGAIPTAFSAAQQATNRNTIALEAENIALATNTRLQQANAAARGGVAGAASAQAGVIGSATQARLLTGAEIGAAGAGVRAAGAAQSVSKLGTALNLAKGALGGFVGLIGRLSVLGGILSALAALWLVIKDNIVLAKDQMILFSEGGITKAVNGTVSLGDVVGGTFNAIIGKTDTFTQAQIDASKRSADAQVKNIEEVRAADEAALKAREDASVASFERTGSVYATMQDGIVKSTIDAIANVVVIVGGGLVEGFTLAFQGVKRIGLQIMQELTNAGIKFYNGTIVPLLNAGKALGVGNGAKELGTIDLKADEGWKADIEQSRQNLENAGRNIREQLARSITDVSAQRNRGSQLGGLNPDGPSTLVDPTKDAKAKKDKERKRLITEIDQLRQKLDPAGAAVRELEKDADSLFLAFDKGIISLAEFNDLSDRLSIALDKARDPIGTVIAEQEKELKILSLAKNERELATRILAAETAAVEKLGRALSDTEKARISEFETSKQQRERATELKDAIDEAAKARSIEASQFGKTPQLIEAENMARQSLGDMLDKNVAGAKEAFTAQVALNLAHINARDAANRVTEAYQRITQGQRNYAQEMRALIELQKQQPQLSQKIAQEMRNATLAMLQTETTGAAGFARAMITIKQKTEDTAASIQATFENAFSAIEDQFVNIFTGDEIDLHGLAKGITGDLARGLFRKGMDPIISKFGEQFGIPGFGQDASTLGTQYNPMYVVMANGSMLPGAGAPGQSPLDQALNGLFSGSGPQGDQTLTGGGFGSIFKSIFGGMGGGAGGGGGIMSILGGMGGGGGGGGGLMSLLGPLMSFLPPPFNMLGGFLGPLLGFKDGGSFTVGGNGGTDSQLVAFKATPGEDVAVRTPAQQRADAEGEQAGAEVKVDQKIVNVLDPSAMLDALQTTAGQRVLLNVIQSNPEAIKRALSV